MPKRGSPKHCPAVPVGLPAEEARAGVIDLVSKNQVCILVGETGSGKTTRVPQFVLDDVMAAAAKEGKMVGCTQPRRVAAITVSQYVAKCRGCELGREVGYAIRFEDKTSSDTRLKFMTDGILLRELLANDSLPQYSALLLDEAHERTLHGDMLFGLLKQVAAKRIDLKIIVMSATLNAAQFSEYWNKAPVGFIEGRMFPVETFFTRVAQVDYVDACLNTIIQLHLEEPEGDILCFLTGQDEIEDLHSILNERASLLPPSALKYSVRCLYAAMPPNQQILAFEAPPAGHRKIVLSTNIAETSVTIDGIKYVVDTGVAKERRFHPELGIDTLTVEPISKAQARQRLGRAGRVSQGKCFRLYPEESFEVMSEAPTPEILRSNLATVVLHMLSLGITDVMGFDFMDRPSEKALLKGIETLGILEAVAVTDAKLQVTPLGRHLVEFPVEPMAGKAILKALELGVVDEVCSIVAMLSVDGLTVRGDTKDGGDRGRDQFAKTTGDHITLLVLFQAYWHTPKKERGPWCDGLQLNRRSMQKALESFLQLRDIAHGRGHSKRGREEPMVRASSDHEFEAVRQALCYGFFMQAAFYDARRERYVSLFGHQALELHPESVLFRQRKKAPMLLYNAVIHTSKRYMRDVVAVREEWVRAASSMCFGDTG